MYIVLSHWHVLWFVRAGVMALLLVTATQRKTYHQFPVFFTFLSWIGLSSIIMLWMDYAPSISTKQYDNAYEIEVLGETALGFMVLYELLRLRLQDYPAIAKVGMSIFRGAIVILAFITIALAAYIPVGSLVPHIPVQSLMFRSVRTLHCGLLLCIFAFCSYFRLPWRSRLFGFSLGLGWYMGSSLAIQAMRTQLAPLGKTLSTYALNFANEVAFIIAALIWLTYLLMPDTESDEPRQPPPDSDLPAWNQELRRLSE